jgi:hypothetical protein
MGALVRRAVAVGRRVRPSPALRARLPLLVELIAFGVAFSVYVSLSVLTVQGGRLELALPAVPAGVGVWSRRGRCKRRDAGRR